MYYHNEVYLLPDNNAHVWLCPVGEAGWLAGPVAGHRAADAEEGGEGGGQHQHPGEWNARHLGRLAYR